MRKIGGGLLLAIGILTAGASGLCTALFLWPPSGFSGGPTSDIIWLVLLIGGLPFLSGVALIAVGVWLLRSGADT